MYIPSLNISFIHIPKTAGSTLNSKVSEKMEFNIGHTTMGEIIDEKINIPKWGDYKRLILNSHKFSIIRHPYDKIKSYYFYIKKFENGLWGDINKISFDKYLFEPETINSNKYGKLSNQRALWTQTDFLYYNNKLCVDQVILFENFKEEVVELFLSKNSKLENFDEHKLKTDSSKFELSDKHKEFIYEKYKEDFENFNFGK